MDSFTVILGYFFNSWTKVLFGFFAFGISFMIGKQISTSLNITAIVMFLLFFMFADVVFVFAGILCIILGFLSKQGGL
jgi:hypothetical protein